MNNQFIEGEVQNRRKAYLTEIKWNSHGASPFLTGSETHLSWSKHKREWVLQNVIWHSTNHPIDPPILKEIIIVPLKNYSH